MDKDFVSSFLGLGATGLSLLRCSPQTLDSGGLDKFSLPEVEVSFSFTLGFSVLALTMRLVKLKGFDATSVEAGTKMN